MDATQTIAAFNTITKKWKKVGKLNEARTGHGVIMNKGNFIIVGGMDYKKTERCTLEGQSIHCKLINPGLDYYMGYPEMMIVPSDYCEK